MWSTDLFAIGDPTMGAPCAEAPRPRFAVDRQLDSGFGTLAMSVVHDLRSPLAAIHSGAEILTRTTLPEQQVRRVAGNIRSASLRIQEMLQDYVDLCRASESQQRPSRLRSLITQAVDRVADLADAHSVVIVQDVAVDLVVNVERRGIGSVLVNLLANALDAMPGGGSIHISAAAVGTSVVTRVRDTGPGVAPEIRDRLFEPFVSARKRNGWGLGLVHARQAVMQHGGEIWLECPPGGGACFAFSLPA